MDKNFACGLVLGMIGGALIIANSYKARKLVKDSQEQIKSKVTEMAKNCKQQKEEDYDEGLIELRLKTDVKSFSENATDP